VKALIYTAILVYSILAIYAAAIFDHLYIW